MNKIFNVTISNGSKEFNGEIIIDAIGVIYGSCQKDGENYHLAGRTYAYMGEECMELYMASSDPRDATLLFQFSLATFQGFWAKPIVINNWECYEKKGDAAISIIKQPYTLGKEVKIKNSYRKIRVYALMYILSYLNPVIADRVCSATF
ncbi:hypothetical protein IJI18_00925 [Candidatus Saccharibacteria bacterium]|nr:hypothetical protein [Candidatus Saccharibacteria bacterium]